MKLSKIFLLIVSFEFFNVLNVMIDNKRKKDDAKIINVLLF